MSFGVIPENHIPLRVVKVVIWFIPILSPYIYVSESTVVDSRGAEVPSPNAVRAPSLVQASSEEDLH